MARVILEMDVHCTGCAKKIRKAIQYDFGVEQVSASPTTGLVVVYGTADAEGLRRYIHEKLGRRVNIVSHGAPTEPVHAGWGPNRRAREVPQFAAPYGGRVMPHNYHGPQPAYAYQYEEGPQTCCSIQ